MRPEHRGSPPSRDVVGLGRFRAVIFDMDDTLFPERAYVNSGLMAVAEQFATLLGPTEAAGREMVELSRGPESGRIFDVMLARRGLSSDAELVQSMVACYRSHVPQIGFHPDADRALSRLRDRLLLGLISDGPLIMQRLKFDVLGLSGRLDRWILTAELGEGRGKPHPQAFETIAAHLAVGHSACVYVGDNPIKDFVAPNLLGWLTVRIVRPDGVYASAQPPEGGTPHVTISTLDQLEPVLTQADT